MKSLVSINGFKAWIAGITGYQILMHNAQQWFTDSQTDLYVKNLLKLADMEKTGRLSDNEIGNETFSMIKNRKDEKLTVDKAQNLDLYDKIIEKLQTNCYQGLSGARNFTEKLQQKRELFENAFLSFFVKNARVISVNRDGD